jgi:hypothetical protein
MSPKVLLILLLVIALLAVMVIATGFRPGRPTSKTYKQDHQFSGLDKLFGRFRDPFVVGRMSGCSGDGRTLTIPAGGCTVEIGRGDSRSSGFKLTPTVGAVKVCYGFARDSVLNDCVSHSDKWGELKAGYRFDVGKDGAIIVFFCTPAGGSACMVRIILGE